MFREGLARLLEKEQALNVVGQCSSSTEALAILKKSGATMVLLDVDLGGERALDFVTEARKRGFEGQVLVVTGGVSGQEAVQLVQSGVAGILHKHHSGEALRRVIRQVAAGGVCLENDSKLTFSVSRPYKSSEDQSYRSREADVALHLSGFDKQTDWYASRNL
jgi:DNA-binding NarL/FixJ family response regulator